ncbi:MAG: TlpA family protein disulfide reductase [Caulobacteraceae bacterium]|nr:TlpA family protein disulfide reductase [Caulobacteraceae bacterium]
MNEVHGTQVKGGPRRGLAAYALWSVALIGVAAVLYVIVASLSKPGSGPVDLKSLAHGDMASLEVSAKASPPPDTPILDAAGHTLKASDLKAPVVVVNLWATWCAPCVKEMPTLAKLQAAYPGRVLVAPISMDRLADREKARAFIAEHPPLAFYQDPKYALAFALEPPAEGFPTTVIYDRKGHERARLAGGADWSGPDARAVVDALLKEH